MVKNFPTTVLDEKKSEEDEGLWECALQPEGGK